MPTPGEQASVRQPSSAESVAVPQGAPDWVVEAWSHCQLRVRYALRHGRIRTKPYWDRAGRDHWTCYGVTGGRLRLSGAAFDLAVGPGEVAVVPGSLDYRERWLDETGAAACICGFDVLRSPGYDNPLSYLLRPTAVAPGGEDLERRLRDLVDAMRSPGSEGARRVRSRTLLDRLLWDYLERGLATDALVLSREAVVPAWFSATLTELDRRCIDPDLDVNAVVALSGFTAAHVHRAFRRYLGTSPGAWLRRVRIDLAGRMLQHDVNRSVAEVAAACGYRNVHRFQRHFQALTGETPLGYRRGVRR